MRHGANLLHKGSKKQKKKNHTAVQLDAFTSFCRQRRMPKSQSKSRRMAFGVLVLLQAVLTAQLKAQGMATPVLGDPKLLAEFPS